jgi:ABC-2 type transport system ATP-binding protein
MSEVVVSADRVSKDFKIIHGRGTTIKSYFISALKRSKNRSVEIQHALKDVSFEVREGEFFGIVGRNGSGKSTLLKMLAGIYQPTHGKVAAHGKLVPFIELGVGFNPELTGRENVYLNGAMLGFGEKEVMAFYDEVVEFAELEQFMDKKLKNYSSGMQVRLAFSMAIRARADILLIDEVLAVGDMAFQRKCFEYFKALKKNKQTVIFVSHDMNAVQQYCDRALLIDQSKIIEIGEPSHISVLYNKLFIDEKNRTVRGREGASGEERWGDGAASWHEVTVETEIGKGSTTEPEYIVVRASGHAEEDLEYPIIGFSIKNDEFKQLLGTNTIRINKKLSPLKAKEKFAIEWRVRNIFNTGTYYVDCTIAQNQAGQVCDRWPDATDFEIKRVEDNPYPLYTDINCTYNKVK